MSSFVIPIFIIPIFHVSFPLFKTFVSNFDISRSISGFAVFFFCLRAQDLWLWAFYNPHARNSLEFVGQNVTLRPVVEIRPRGLGLNVYKMVGMIKIWLKIINPFDGTDRFSCQFVKKCYCNIKYIFGLGHFFKNPCWGSMQIRIFPDLN